MDLAVEAAYRVLRLSQRTPFRAAPRPKPDSVVEAERTGAQDFYRYFPDLPRRMAGKRVLDFGCGHGGKTLAYAAHAGSVPGIEPFPSMIATAERARKAWG